METKQKSITIEELKALKPSPEKPVKLVCMNGTFSDDFSHLSVVGVHGEAILTLNSGLESYMHASHLYNYGLLRKEKKVKHFYQCRLYCKEKKCWFMGDFLVDEEFKNNNGTLIYGVEYERALLLDRPIEIEVGDE